MLNAFVLFSVLASECTPFKIPTMIAKMTTSPTEAIVKDILETRLRSSDSKLACSSCLNVDSILEQVYEPRSGRTYGFWPSDTSSADFLTSGRSRANPGNAAVQNVRAH